MNGICLLCLEDYCKTINEKQNKINELVAEINNISLPHLTAVIKVNAKTRKVQVKKPADVQPRKSRKKKVIKKEIDDRSIDHLDMLDLEEACLYE